MAAERRSSTGWLAAWAVSTLVLFIPFAGAPKLDPDEINPFKEAGPEDEGLAKAKAFIAKRKWRALVDSAKGERHRG